MRRAPRWAIWPGLQQRKHSRKPAAGLERRAGVCNPLNTNAQASLTAFEQVGLVHMLAEPNLTAVSGETAKFLAGGEFPIPAARDNNGNITVDYKQFGVGLSFTPVVLSSGLISLQISTEVSQLSSAGSYQIGAGHQCPDGAGPSRAPRLNDSRTAVGRHLRHCRPDAA